MFNLRLHLLVRQRQVAQGRGARDEGGVLLGICLFVLFCTGIEEEEEEGR